MIIIFSEVDTDLKSSNTSVQGGKWRSWLPSGLFKQHVLSLLDCEDEDNLTKYILSRAGILQRGRSGSSTVEE